MTRILSFDCSSTTIGYAVLEINNNNIKYIDSGYIKPPKKGELMKRIAQTRDKIQKIITSVKPDEIAIEEILQFIKGKSTAKVIITLATFNRMIALLAYDYLKKSPIFYHVLSIRHGLKIGTKKAPDKSEMPALVCQHLNFTFPTEYNKNRKIKEENFDRADAIAVGLYHAFVLTKRVIRKNKTKKRKKK